MAETADSALPTIGVVVPSFNQGRFLGQALDSIFCQRYPALEVVVMDGGSTDETLSVIRSFEDRLTFWTSTPDAGQAAAINEGAQHCRGELLAWLNSDDFYLEGSLWMVARAYQDHAGAGLYIGNGLRRRERDGRLTPFSRRHLALDRCALTEGLDYVLQPATFFLRRAWDEVQGLRSDLHYCMDWNVILRIAQRHPAVLINEFLATSREHDETKTSLGKLPRALEILRMTRDHAGLELTDGGLHYLLETLLENGGALTNEARSALVAALESVHRRFQHKFGSADGFPVKGDPQDFVFLPLVKSSGAPVRARAQTPGLPSISMVVAALHPAPFLDRAIDSILGQGYPGLELCVVDSAGGAAGVESLGDGDGRAVRVVAGADRGTAHAINRGFDAATGEVLGWLDPCDMLSDGALLAAGRAFEKDPELDMVIGNALYVDEADQPCLVDRGTYRTGLCYGEAESLRHIDAYWAYVHAVPQPTALFRRRLLEAHGGLSESYQSIFDLDLFLRFAANAKIGKLERTQALCRVTTAGRTGAARAELYRFSRRFWPPAPSRAFWATWRAFVAQYVRDHYGHGLGEKRLWPIAAAVAAASLVGMGNPETWRCARRRFTPPDER